MTRVRSNQAILPIAEPSEKVKAKEKEKRKRPGETAANVSSRTGRTNKVSKLRQLLKFDREIIMGGGQLDLFSQTNFEHIIGVDEVGRGCLAGPVVACAVMLPNPLEDRALMRELKQLNDSKMLAEPVRNALSATIREKAMWAIGEATPEEIDTINILWASLLAMRRAVSILTKKQSLKRGNCLVLVDGNRPIKSLTFRQLPVIKGDSTSASIAAASVVAKVHRDALMRSFSEQYPGYGWESNKGYPSRVHRDAIVEFGMTPLHRRSFRCVVEEEQED